jgi:hypothetical protein
MRGRTTADDVKKVALAALATALDDGKQEARQKPGLTGMRAVATGAVLYTAGRAAVSGRRFYRDHFGSDSHNGAEAESDEDYDAEADAEEDEDFEDEPESEEDEEFEEEPEEEPEAEEDEDFEEEPEDEPEAAGDRPPVHGDEPEDEDLPPRPSRRRKPVKT